MYEKLCLNNIDLVWARQIIRRRNGQINTEHQPLITVGVWGALAHKHKMGNTRSHKWKYNNKYGTEEKTLKWGRESVARVSVGELYFSTVYPLCISKLYFSTVFSICISQVDQVSPRWARQNSGEVVKVYILRESKERFASKEISLNRWQICIWSSKAQCKGTNQPDQKTYLESQRKCFDCNVRTRYVTWYLKQGTNIVAKGDINFQTMLFSESINNAHRAGST